jgi:hypothetical protein
VVTNGQRLSGRREQVAGAVAHELATNLMCQLLFIVFAESLPRHSQVGQHTGAAGALNNLCVP